MLLVGWLVGCMFPRHSPLVVVRCPRSDVNKVTHVFRSHNTSVKRLNPLAPVSVRLPVPSHARRAIPAPLRRLRPDPPSDLLCSARRTPDVCTRPGQEPGHPPHGNGRPAHGASPAPNRPNAAVSLPSAQLSFFFSRSLLFSPSSLPAAALTYPPAFSYLTSRQPPPPPPPPTPCQHSRARTADSRAGAGGGRARARARCATQPPDPTNRQQCSHSLFCGCRAKVMLSRCWQRSRTRLSR
ncbi:hypothetical protein IWX47DRAFT_289339 [Phyllosticta citricarpa]